MNAAEKVHIMRPTAGRKSLRPLGRHRTPLAWPTDIHAVCMRYGVLTAPLSLTQPIYCLTLQPHQLTLSTRRIGEGDQEDEKEGDAEDEP